MAPEEWFTMGSKGRISSKDFSKMEYPMAGLDGSGTMVQPSWELSKKASHMVKEKC